MLSERCDSGVYIYAYAYTHAHTHAHTHTRVGQLFWGVRCCSWPAGAKGRSLSSLTVTSR
jgi:hypothetical protein